MDIPDSDHSGGRSISDVDAQIEQILVKYSPKAIFEDLQRSGWVKPHYGDGSRQEPSIPDNLDTMSLQELRGIAREYQAWNEYLSNVQTMLVVAKEMLGEARDAVEAALVRVMPSKNASERKMLVRSHPAFVQVNAEYTKTSAALKAFESRMKKNASGQRTISRQVAMVLGPNNFSGSVGDPSEDWG